MVDFRSNKWDKNDKYLVYNKVCTVNLGIWSKSRGCSKKVSQRSRFGAQIQLSFLIILFHYCINKVCCWPFITRCSLYEASSAYWTKQKPCLAPINHYLYNWGKFFSYLLCKVSCASLNTFLSLQTYFSCLLF
jgi:hypothetical protein